MTNEHLDRAISAADKALEDYVSDTNNEINMVEYGRIHASALVAELLRDMPTFFANPPARATEAVCNEIRRRAGLEGEG